MQHWQSGALQTNGIRLHYTRTGGALPPLVLAHGFSDDGLCWTSVAQELAASYDVVMVDARGHGRSEAPEQGYGPTEHADDLAGVIAGMGLRPPIVLGHSMGAITALALAGRYPDVPRAILLEDPPPLWLRTAELPPGEHWRRDMHTWITGLQSHTREELISAQRAEAPNWSEAELGPWAESKLRLHLNVFNQAGSTDVDWSVLLQRIVCPALLIMGDSERGAIVTRQQAAALQALVPHLRQVHIAGAGHNIRRDQFVRFMEVVRAFLSELTDPGQAK